MEYIHHDIGYNYRMNNLLAALGTAQLETLEERVAAKRANFARYEEAFGPRSMIQEPPGPGPTAGSTGIFAGILITKNGSFGPVLRQIFRFVLCGCPYTCSDPMLGCRPMKSVTLFSFTTEW